MARQRIPLRPGELVGTKGHSTLKRSTYAMPVRRHEPIFVPRSHAYSTPRHDYSIDNSISKAGYLSNAVLEDTYEAAAKSRGRDHDLLKNANAAIISTEQHVSPRVSVVSRRVRASTAPPASRPAPAVKVVEAPVAAPRPLVLLMSSNTSRPNQPAHRSYSPSRPVVPSDREAPWLVRARSSSVQPPEVRRHVRGASVPPLYSGRRASLSYQELPASTGTEQLWAHRPMKLRKDAVRLSRAHSLEPVRRSPAPYYYAPRGSVGSQEQMATQTLWAHRPMLLRKDAVRASRARALEREHGLRSVSVPRDLSGASSYYHSLPDVKQRALTRYLYAHRGRFGSDTKPRRTVLGDFPQVYVPWTGQGPSNRAKAAIIGSRMEAEEGASKKKRRPRSQYAADKLREIKREQAEEGVFYRSPSSGGLHASRPPLPKPTERRAIRDVDGFTKPKNLMSWQYRVDSRLSPDDVIYQPSRFVRMREQVRDAQEKMDRQRQLLDRYLDTDFQASSSSRNAASGEGSAGGDPNHMPVSDLRRKLRRKIAQAKNNPDYYRE